MREGDTPLTHAARHGHVADVAALLAGGANVNEPTTDGSCKTALSIACHRGHTEVAAKLLAANANVDQANKHGYAPMSIACAHGHLGCVQLLSSYGARRAWPAVVRSTDLRHVCENSA